MSASFRRSVSRTEKTYCIRHKVFVDVTSNLLPRSKLILITKEIVGVPGEVSFCA